MLDAPRDISRLLTRRTITKPKDHIDGNLRFNLERYIADLPCTIWSPRGNSHSLSTREQAPLHAAAIQNP